MNNQHTFVSAATRSIMPRSNGSARFYPASGKQQDFLCSLLDGRVHDIDAEATTDLMADRKLSKKAASALIDILLKCPRAPKPGAAPKVNAQDVAEGYYQLGADFVVVKFNRAGTNKYAMRMATSDGANATWQYEAGLITKVARDGTPLTLEAAKAFGKLYGVCCICARVLTNPVSIEAGIGPICGGRL